MLLPATGETSGQNFWPFYSKFPFVPVGQRARCACWMWGQPPWHFRESFETVVRLVPMLPL